jgi:hypothetical protein
MTAPAGTPCFIDLATTDADGAVSFYSNLFGWRTREEDTSERYTSALIGDQSAAGIFAERDGFPRGWILYLAAPDGDVAAQVSAADGKIMNGPIDVGHDVTIWHVSTPGGAEFGLWRSSTPFPFAYRVPGALTYAELFTAHGEATDVFLSAVFGLSGAQVGDGKTFDYTYWPTNWGRFGGQSDEAWSVYFQVPDGRDTDEVAARAVELGGAVTQEPADSPHGRLARFTDPQGIPFTVIDPSTAQG